MNRIYQGRVTKVEISDGNSGWKPFDIKSFEAVGTKSDYMRLFAVRHRDIKSFEADQASLSLGL